MRLGQAGSYLNLDKHANTNNKLRDRRDDPVTFRR